MKQVIAKIMDYSRDYSLANKTDYSQDYKLAYRPDQSQDYKQSTANTINQLTDYS